MCTLREIPNENTVKEKSEGHKMNNGEENAKGTALSHYYIIITYLDL